MGTYRMNAATVRARSNIALVKYWGKADAALNTPAVGSISITLDRLFTETRVVPRIGGYVSSAAMHAEGDLPDALDGGFSTVDLFGAELWVEHDSESYQWRVSADFADVPGTELLQDAWVGTTLVDVLDVRLGRQKPPLAISANTNSETSASTRVKPASRITMSPRAHCESHAQPPLPVRRRLKRAPLRAARAHPPSPPS